jgi:CRISPR-associated endonuclease/helicase Cas3
VDPREEFCSRFALLTGHAPFPWQQKLFDALLEARFPEALDIPTGLGKTSVIAIWLLALAQHAHTRTTTSFPRRLVYVVNRRSVVDQATTEAEHVRHALFADRKLQPIADVLRSLTTGRSGNPLAISTPRGRFADDTSWCDDPSQPAVIVGTVDTIGSRLLFAGYGCRFESRPQHAGLLGQDTLLVHDEAHLEPAFQKLVTAIAAEQERGNELRRFRVMALTPGSASGAGPLRLTEADRRHAVARKRIEARKAIRLHHVGDESAVAERVARFALEHKRSGQAILVCLRKADDVEAVAATLAKARLPVLKLTGTLRGLERDALVKEDPVLARFIRNPALAPAQGSVFLVCTSAGELGADISADHLVCDTTTFDRMQQRFGRVNRVGGGDARIDVVYPTFFDERDVLREAKQRTLELLRALPHEPHGRDASLAALGRVPIADREAASAVSPTILPATDILFDAWALTSIRGKLPGRPPVADWLRGVAEWEPPDTSVAWREEVALITADLQERHNPEDLLDDYPLKPHEVLRDWTSRVLGHLEKIARRHPELSAWVVTSDGGVRVLRLAQLVETDRHHNPVVDVAGCSVLLPPAAGGLRNGTLDGDVEFAHDHRVLYDVSDQPIDECFHRRCRLWDEAEPGVGMRLVRSIDTWRPTADNDAYEDEQSGRRRHWRWYVQPRSAEDAGVRGGVDAESLSSHGRSAERCAHALVRKLGLSECESAAVTLAARWHDLGKDRAIWQRSIGNRQYPHHKLASPGATRPRLDLSGYRHEFGSLIDVSNLPGFLALEPGVQDLILHLIAAHHGRARPHFSADEAFDPDRPEAAAAGIARDTPRRFGRLQRKYGRWGLAYLESLVRAADALATEPHDAIELETDDVSLSLAGAVPR